MEFLSIDINHPIMVAVKQKDLEAIGKIINSTPSLVNTEEDSFYKKLLHYAVEANSNSIVEFLLDRGAEVNCGDTNYITPLHIAAIEGYANIVDTLLQFGAYTNAEDIRDLTPLDCAIKNGHTDVINVLMGNIFCAIEKDSYEHLEKIVDRNSASLNERVMGGFTPLDIAVSKHNVKLTKFLINKGTDVNSKTDKGFTPLFQAEYSDIAELLISNGANVNEKNQFSRTPLHHAAKDNCIDIVKILLKHGAKSNIKDSDGETALSLASQNGHTTIADILTTTSQ